MVRALVLVLVCGCQGVFSIRHVDPSPIDASLTDAPIAGLVAYYPMDALGDPAACMTDARGGPSGRCNNGMPTLVSTIHGMGFQFDGTASVTVVGAPAPDNAPFTVTAWISLVTPLTTDVQCPASRVYGAAGADSWQFCLSSGVVYYYAGSAGTFGDGTAITVGTWHQLAIAFDGTMIQGYLDGVPGMTMPATIFFDAQPTVVGLDLDGNVPAAPYTQIVDELAIYDRALTPTELARLYQM